MERVQIYWLATDGSGPEYTVEEMEALDHVWVEG